MILYMDWKRFLSKEEVGSASKEDIYPVATQDNLVFVVVVGISTYFALHHQTICLSLKKTFKDVS